MIWNILPELILPEQGLWIHTLCWVLQRYRGTWKRFMDKSGLVSDGHALTGRWQTKKPCTEHDRCEQRVIWLYCPDWCAELENRACLCTVPISTRVRLTSVATWSTWFAIGLNWCQQQCRHHHKCRWLTQDFITSEILHSVWTGCTQTVIFNVLHSRCRLQDGYRARNRRNFQHWTKHENSEPAHGRSLYKLSASCMEPIF